MAAHTPTAPPAFRGFDLPRQNWFKMPNDWTDITAGITSLAELKVIEYVLKHTWGYQEYGLTKRITIDEFMHGRRRKDGSRMDRGTGLSKPSVVAGLKSAVAHGYLEEIVNDADLARIKKYYSLKMHPELRLEDDDAASLAPLPPPPAAGGDGDEADQDPEEKMLAPDVKMLAPDVKNLNTRGKDALHRSEKDTLERHQQTENSNNTRDAAGLGNDVVVVALMNHGISRPVARRLARLFPADYIQDKERYLAFLLEERPHEVKKPAAWLRKAIEDDYSAPDGFVSVADREQVIEEQKRRNEAILAAQERELEARSTAENARKAAAAAKRARLHAHFGTGDEAITLWRTVLTELSYSGGALYALLANAEILQLDDSRVQLGIPHEFHLRELQHPRLQTAIARTLKNHTRRDLRIELISIADDMLDDLPPPPP